MTNREAINWLINVTADIGKVEHQDLWHYEQALSEIREMLESAPEPCKDAVSREAVLSDLKRWIGYLDEDMIERMGIGMKKLPSVQPYTDEQIQRMQDMEQAQLDKAFELGREDAKPQWIPCSERLPEHSGWYIVTKKLTDDGDKAVCLSWYSFHGWEWGENPIAWMPMPEPYREEGEQE